MLYFLLIISCNANCQVELSIPNRVENIVDLIEKNNLDKLNKGYIHPKYGIYETRKRGVYDIFTHHHKIKEEYTAYGSLYQVLSSIKKNKNHNLVYSDKVLYDCDSYSWTGKGVFVSKPARKEFFINESVQHLSYIMEYSYKIIFTEEDVVFYLTEIDSNYYLTLIDRSTRECGS